MALVRPGGVVVAENILKTVEISTGIFSLTWNYVALTSSPITVDSSLRQPTIFILMLHNPIGRIELLSHIKLHS